MGEAWEIGANLTPDEGRFCEGTNGTRDIFITDGGLLSELPSVFSPHRLRICAGAGVIGRETRTDLREALASEII